MPDPGIAGPPFEPRIVAFLCEECCGTHSPWHIDDKPLKLNKLVNRCAIEVTPMEVHDALDGGADGVIIISCLLADCPQVRSQLEALRSIYGHQVVLKKLGMRQERLRQEWVAPCEWPRLRDVLVDFAETIRDLGPAHAEELRQREGTA